MTAAHHSLEPHLVCQKRCCKYLGDVMRGRAADAAEGFCHLAICAVTGHGVSASTLRFSLTTSNHSL